MKPYIVFDLPEICQQANAYFQTFVDGVPVISHSLASDQTLTLRLYCDKRLACSQASLQILDDATQEWRTYSHEKMDFTNTNDVFEFSFLPQKHTGKKQGLFFFRFSLESPYGTLYTQRSMKWRQADDAPFSSLKRDFSWLQVTQDASYWDEGLFVLTVTDPGDKICRSIEGANIYHVFVDRFAKGQVVYRREDASFDPDWENGVPEFAPIPGGFIKNNTHFGGSLEGVLAKLDYLQDLHVDYIYLSPVFKAYSNHKYDTGDYMQVDDLFGGELALKTLIDACHKRGIGVILDGVFNHTGDNSVYFNKYNSYPNLGAYQSTSSPYYSWYDFTEHPDRYESWWGVQCLPTIRKRCPEFWEYIAGEKGVIEKYTRLGVDGFRLDVVDELEQEFLNRIRTRQRKINRDSCLIGEVWEDASYKKAYGTRKNYFSTNNLDGVINYPLRNCILDYLLTGDAPRIAVGLNQILENYPIHNLLSSMNVLSTHDTERIVTLLGEPGCKNMTPTQQSVLRLDSQQKRRAQALQRLGAVIQFPFPGAPTLYYGDETSMEGGKDPFNRLCYPWHAQDKDMIDFYQRLSGLHKAHPALRYGSCSVIYAKGSVLVYQRELEGKTVLVLINQGATPIRHPLPYLSATDLFNDTKLSDRIDLSPCSFAILKV